MRRSATSSSSVSGAAARKVERVLGPASRIDAVLEGLLWHEGAARPHAPLPPLPPDDEPDRVDLRDLFAFTIDPEEAKDFDDALSLPARGRRRARLGAHRRRLGLRARRARRSTATPPSAASRSTSPAGSSRCSRTSSPTTSAACGRTRTGAASPSRSPSTADLDPGEPRFYRSLIRSRERLTYGHAQAILAGRRARRRRARRGARASPSRSPARSATGASRAARSGSRAARSSSPSTARAASSAPGSRRSRSRTCSSRS